jgi:2-polyprenyl-3-methyl-5-hydroxy-6-metoxy-1,4-benzoquinol methylase/Flp pilus assembly protein TadD
MNRKQRRATQQHRVPPSRPIFDSALAHLHANRLSEALSLFRQVLELDPRHADSLHHLGSIALKIGQAEGAITLSRQALAIAADHVEAHRTLANALAMTGQLAEAEKHYKQALALKPDAVTYSNLASVYVLNNNLPLALDATLRGLKIEETPKLKSLFVVCVQQTRSVPNNADFRAFLVRAISEPWKLPSDLVSVSLDILRHDKSFTSAMDRAVQFWPKRATLAELYGQDGLAKIAGDQLLCALLENAQFADIGLERLLTLTRSALLHAVLDGGEDAAADESTLAFFCALAQQCFTNDYVFAQSTEETEKVGILGEKLNAAVKRGEHPDPLTVAAFAAYAPLHILASCEALQDLTWPSPVQKLFTRQVREPLAERALRSSIPQMTAIGDEVSALVRDMYEENPYPRWVKIASDIAPETIDRLIQARHPGAPYSPLGETDVVDVLIAGCGTGRQVVEMAGTTRNAQIIAIDLSLSSLSYAKYRTDALGLNNVTYGQGDILELGSLGRSFDVIVCSGVLHHMKDPLHGWRTLLSILRPTGVMVIALYSEAARVEITAAREFVAKRGYGGSADDIRRARQEILALDTSAPVRAVVHIHDFFGTSTCRDLLFHVQEACFTIPQIKAFLDEHGLEFLGFMLPPPYTRDYLTLFPEDQACTNLDTWHQFECDRPGLFLGMYQFTVQKKP